MHLRASFSISANQICWARREGFFLINQCGLVLALSPSQDSGFHFFKPPYTPHLILHKRIEQAETNFWQLRAVGALTIEQSQTLDDPPEQAAREFYSFHLDLCSHDGHYSARQGCLENVPVCTINRDYASYCFAHGISISA